MASCVSWPTVRIPVPTTASDPAAWECVCETSTSVSADTSPPPVAVVRGGSRGGALLETLERQLKRRELQRRGMQRGGMHPQPRLCGGGDCPPRPRRRLHGGKGRLLPPPARPPGGRGAGRGPA